MRSGFVYKTEDDLIGTFRPGRSALNGALQRARSRSPISASTAAAGTADDTRRSLCTGCRRRCQAQFPLNQVVMNIPGDGRYVALQDGRSVGDQALQQQVVGPGRQRLHLVARFHRDVASSFPQTPDRPGIQDRTGWGVKIAGTYDAAVGHPDLAAPPPSVGRQLRPSDFGSRQPGGCDRASG